MTRGNQRDRDRERAQARNNGKGKNKDDGLTPEQRRERDAKALQEKAAKKAGQAAGGSEPGARLACVLAFIENKAKTDVVLELLRLITSGVVAATNSFPQEILNGLMQLQKKDL